jgi:hypothetical protein
MKTKKLTWVGNGFHLESKIESLGFDVMEMWWSANNAQIVFTLAGGIKVTWYRTTGTLLPQGKNAQEFRSRWIGGIQ